MTVVAPNWFVTLILPVTGSRDTVAPLEATPVVARRRRDVCRRRHGRLRRAHRTCRRGLGALRNRRHHGLAPVGVFTAGGTTEGITGVLGSGGWIRQQSVQSLVPARGCRSASVGT